MEIIGSLINCANQQSKNTKFLESQGEELQNH